MQQILNDLSSYGLQSIEWQKEHRDVIIIAFKALWDDCPSERVFAEYTSGLVVFPEMLYYMATNPHSFRY